MYSWSIVVVILIGGALLLGIGPFGTDGGDANVHLPSPLERQAERIEKELAASPGDKKLLLATMQAWIAAGNDRLSERNRTGRPIPNAVPEDFKAGLWAWHRYLRETGGKAGADIAEFAGETFFTLVEIGSTDPGEAEANAAGAARALRIAGKQRPTLYTLSNVAVYEYFNGEYAAGNRAARGAAADVSKAAAKGVIGQLDEYRERGETFVRQVKRGARELRESGEEELAVPIKGYGSPAGINQGQWPSELR